MKRIAPRMNAVRKKLGLEPVPQAENSRTAEPVLERGDGLRARFTGSDPPGSEPAIAGHKADRRLETRREPAADRAFAPLAVGTEELAATGWMTWPVLTLTMTLSTLAAFVLTGAWPGAVVALALVASLVAVAVGEGQRGRVRNGMSGGAIGISLTMPLVPLFLFGLGMGGWVAHGSLGWDAAGTFLSATAIISAVYLRKQPALGLAGPWFLWLGAILADVWIGGLLGLAGAGLAAGLAALVVDQRTPDLRRVQQFHRLSRFGHRPYRTQAQPGKRSRALRISIR
jgi:hypothetical protein